MKKEAKYEGFPGMYSGADGPNLLEFMAPRVLGMICGIAGIFIVISMIQAVFGIHPILIRELWMQLFT